MLSQTTVNLNQIVGHYVLFTGSVSDVALTRLVIRLPNINVADDVNITGISVQTNNTSSTVFITQGEGLKAGLTAEKELMWAGPPSIINVGTAIRLTIYGGAADADTICKVFAEYIPISGGRLI